MSKSPIQIRNDKLAEKVIKNLKKHFFDAYYVQTCEEAVALALSLIPEGNSVSWGGSQTIRDIGLTKALHEGNYNVLDRDLYEGAERMEVMRRALLCDTYVTSTNAISEDGCLVNIDGNGNRVAAMCFGPKSVVVIAGMNKIAPTVADAHVRARHTAAPMNAQRFQGSKTGCMVTGACENCCTNDTICCYMVETRLSRPAGKIKVILVGEELGY